MAHSGSDSSGVEVVYSSHWKVDCCPLRQCVFLDTEGVKDFCDYLLAHSNITEYLLFGQNTKYNNNYINFTVLQQGHFFRYRAWDRSGLA